MEGPMGTRYVIRHTVNEPPHPHGQPRDAQHDLPQADRRRQALLAAAGVVLLMLWAWWWFETLRRGQMVLAQHTRIPAWRFLGLDFLHNYWGVRVWVAGGNPYHVEIGDWRGKYAYPPIALPLFAWSALFSEGTAIRIWMAVITAIVAAGAWMAWRVRRTLEVAHLPLVFILATALCSMPVLFATERGQADAVCLAMIVIVALLWWRPSTWMTDIAMGVCIAVAAWVKIYPAVLVPALLVLRRPRAFSAAVAAAVLIGIVPYQATIDSFRASAQGERMGFVREIQSWLTDPDHVRARAGGYGVISVDSHSLTTYWGRFWDHFGLTRLATMPGLLGAALVLAPLALWVSFCVWRSPARASLTYPYLLWLTALATFGLPVSYDYNLIYLPLAALAVCDRRDPPRVAVALIGMLAWWQPFRVPWEMHLASAFALFGAEPPVAPLELLLRLECDVLFFLKLFAAVGVGMSIVVRAKCLDPSDPAELSAPVASADRLQGANASS
jgi:hypothetical protein